MKTLCLLLALIAGSLATTTFGQVPQLINYQGRVVVGTTNFDGTGAFKFALVNSNGAVSFWSNDGTSSAGSQPAASINLTVVKGLYAVLLGDTAIAGMTTPLPTTVFTNFDVRLRVWFNDGVTGFQQFTPDQRITAVGYALMGATVPDGAITSNKLAAASVTATKIADGSVTATKLADGSITSTKLAVNSVVSSNLADSIGLGQTNVNGQLDVYHTTAGTPAISLIGSGSQISTYGSDGLEQIRLWGASYGEILLHNSLPNNATAVNLSAQGANGAQLALNNTNGSNRALIEGENTGGKVTLYQADGSTGTILYGNDGNGSGALSLKKTNGVTGLNLLGGPGSGSFSLYNDAGNVSLYGYSFAGREGTFSVRNNAGDETIYLWARDSFGSQDGQIGLKKGSGTETITIQAGEGVSGGSQIVMRNLAGTQTVQLDADASGVHCGYLALYSSNGVATVVMDADGTGDGKVTTQVLQITGGSDLSEQFDIKAIHDEVKPGMIVSIDPDKPGHLMTSTKACDKTVAGIVSGAGGVQTGMLMGQRGTPADGKHPVALTGRVYCYVDADAGGAIEPGDMITTSATPGHGMKVTDHAQASGAIIGKAMSRLASGKGLVLVLVSLQ